MKAIVISGPGRAAMADIEPGALSPGDVRIKVLSTGVCGTDVELFDGSMPYLASGMAQYPFVPGHEWVGEVREIGTQVKGFEIGDRVVGECSCGCMRCDRCRSGQYHRCLYRTETGILNRPGAFADYIHFPAAFLHRISKNVPIETACLIEPAAVAFNGVRRANVSPSDDVAIFGDGPIGLLLLMMARAFGAHSVAVVGATPHRLAMAEKLGADLIINGLEERASEVLTQGNRSRRPSVVFEATGNPDTIVEALRSTASGGRMIVQGIFAGKKLNGLDLDRVVIEELTVAGVLGSPGIWPEVIRLIESGRVDPGALVTDAVGIMDYARAIENVKQRHGIKTIVRPRE